MGKKTKIVNVVYNPVSNEMVRTNTLTKGTIVFVDATPFQRYIYGHYHGRWDVGKGQKVEKATKDSKNKYLSRRLATQFEQKIQDQLVKGSLMCRITSRPGQSGRADGYILEGRELEFYSKKLPKKKF